MKKKLRYSWVLICWLFSTVVYSQQVVNANTPEITVAKKYLANNTGKYKLANSDINDMSVSSAYLSPSTGWYHIYFNQTYQNIEVFNGMLNIALKGNNIIHVGNSFVENLTSKIQPDAKVSIQPIEALQKAIIRQNITMSALQAVQTLSTTKLPSGIINKATFFDSQLSNENIEVKLYWLPVERTTDTLRQTVALVWRVRFSTKDFQNQWSIHVDAASGQILKTTDEVIHCYFGSSHLHTDDEKIHHSGIFGLQKSNVALVDSSYNVFDIPLESPNHGSRMVVEKPYTRFASAGTGPGGTNGWHNDGTTDYTTTRGNNVWAQEDVNRNNGTGASPTSATLEFDSEYTQGPSTATANQNAAIINLFYWNNLIHDVLYKYGFDEPSGNFQKNNMGRGGAGNDFVYADAQDGGGLNNANFSTPVDGQSGRMQMYLWSTSGGYQPDGDFDNGVIAHEYGHGWSTRLTGGPANSGCLFNAEQGGEGWSDYLGLMLTTNWSSLSPDIASANIPRGMASYSLGQATTGVGIRINRYSYDMDNVNGWVTYGKVGDIAYRIPHEVGSIWATMLWDMTWEIIMQDNQIVGDIHNTTSLVANIAALKLVNEGLRLQPCSPSFVEARDAILVADLTLFNGRYRCAISRAFARRGLGKYASTGISSDDREVFEDFTPIVEPSLSSPIANKVCSNAVFSYTAASATNGVSFSWTRPMVAGISNAASSGNSASISETLVNTTNQPITVSYYFSLNPVNACSGTQPITVVVAPQSIPTTPFAICKGGTVLPGEGLFAPGKIYSISGNITAGPTYRRGNGDGISYYSASSIGSAVYYQTITFMAQVSGKTFFEITSANLTGSLKDDTYLTLYQSSFNPASPATNFLVGDDDTGAGFRSSLAKELVQGSTYVLVVSTYSNNVTGTFTMKSSHPVFSNEALQWYANPSGGTSLATGTVFNPVGVAGSGLPNTLAVGSTNFYVADPDLPDCRTPAVFTLTPPQSGPPITYNGLLCEDGAVTLNPNEAKASGLSFVKSNSQYVTVPHSSSINLGTTFTMEAWVNYSGLNSTIVDKGDYDFLWSLNANDNASKMGFFNKNTTTWVYSTAIVPQNTWTHVAITLDNGTLTFYINGIASGTAPVTPAQDNLPMNIGRQQPTACQCNHFNGTMDELRIWNIVRTQAQIKESMPISVATTSDGLVAYYKFDEGTGSTTADATSNGNNGTLINDPTWQSVATTNIWLPGGATTPNITATAGTYSVTLFKAFGCPVESSIELTPVAMQAPAAPIITPNGPIAICNEAPITLHSNIANNNALSFLKASSQYLTVPHSASINLGATATMEAWVNYSGINSTIVDKGDYDFLWQLNTNGNANKMGFFNKSTTTWAYSTAIVPQNTWTHVAITLSGGNVTFYINGVASGTATVGFSQDTEEMNIGRQQPTYCKCNFFNGSMDELRIWNVVRTEAEIQANKNTTIAANSAGLVAYYKFDEGTGTTTADATTNNNHATFVNDPTWQVPSASPVNTLVWYPGGAKTPSITVTTPGIYIVSIVDEHGCANAASTFVSIGSIEGFVTLTSPSNDYSSGTVLKTASSINGNISATNKITGTANVTYKAKSLDLNSGFKVDNGTVFLAEIGGCN